MLTLWCPQTHSPCRGSKKRKSRKISIGTSMRISVEIAVPIIFICKLYVFSIEIELGSPDVKSENGVCAILQTRRAARFLTSTASGETDAMRKRGRKQQLGLRIWGLLPLQCNAIQQSLYLSRLGYNTLRLGCCLQSPALASPQRTNGHPKCALVRKRTRREQLTPRAEVEEGRPSSFASNRKQFL